MEKFTFSYFFNRLTNNHDSTVDGSNCILKKNGLKILEKSERALGSISLNYTTKITIIQEASSNKNEDNYIKTFEDLPVKQFIVVYKIEHMTTSYNVDNGKSLKYMIRLNNLLDYSEVTSYLCQILKAVGFLHEKLILHSFINTATIYVTRNNQIILGGMNFSKQLKSKTDYTRIERHVDKDCHDPYIGFKYDTFCIGKVLYEMIISDEYTEKIDIRTLMPRIYRNLKPILLKLINHNMFERPSVLDVLADSNSVDSVLNIMMNNLAQIQLLENLKGTTIESKEGKYTICGLISFGGNFGTIYQAEKSEINSETSSKTQTGDGVEKVRMKRVKKFLKDKMFDQEAKIIDTIKPHEKSHENILKYYNCFSIDDYYYIISENCDDISLKYYLEVFSENLLNNYNKQIEWASQLLSALKHLHSNGIIHRHIRPGIILVDKENTLKIADFSSSKKMPELNTESVAQTRFSLSLYRAPEIASSNYTNKVDIWSAGCVIFEICTLSKAIDIRNRNEITKNITEGKINDSLREDHCLYKLIKENMLKKKAEERWDAEQCFENIEEKKKQISLKNKSINHVNH